MLIAFKSPAAPELLMTEDLAHYLVGLLGKTLGVRGVIHHDEMSSAISRLESAIAVDKAKHAAHESHYATASGDPLHHDAVHLAQRAFPLLDMMRLAHKKNADVLWGV
ncbi:hypothetical protein WM40_05345 [Robbsia andropogonis]|uniref:DUF1840 domain-containing protein n=1 Tax=Robbsia andropogonis TaxID=28092 RepID=A0A0F5K3A1_9BURK|nr:DUF1840 domain-containing protein [Robbsia andropogonis]KKB64364.1 hypothetical protein WM40_05345 [Robbsia andropogonis]MCP1120657.1 DUF1840 domain-containing protein [Robbsia andropogonis]MCP1130392.1 DUF1840 domain-containing protein [Robbsia andropogonis]